MLKTIINSISLEEKQLEVSKVILGLGYFAVEIEDSLLGLSANITRERPSCTVVREAGTLAGSKVGDLIEMGGDLVHNSIAIATINALRNHRSKPGNLEIDADSGTRVAMVGMIEPVAKEFSRKGAHVDVFDNNPHPQLSDPGQLDSAIENADIIILTGTSLINATIDDLLSIDTRASHIVLMGPSTPMVPGIFKDTKITHLAGSRVTDPSKAMNIVMEGGGTKLLYRMKAAEKVLEEV